MDMTEHGAVGSTKIHAAGNRLPRALGVRNCYELFHILLFPNGLLGNLRIQRNL